MKTMNERLEAVEQMAKDVKNHCDAQANYGSSGERSAHRQCAALSDVILTLVALLRDQAQG
jgi:hypothetical protein